jgi:mono/diheme cytochrome c family protein
MDDRKKQEYLEAYKKRKEEHGVPFFPDLLWKDAIVALLVFIILVGLAYFVGAPLEERANPGDTAYTPRPEWYFLFLFQLLKYFPGSLEVIGVFVIPTLAILLLIALPFLDRGMKRYPLHRLWVIGITALVFLGIVGLTVQSFLEAPPPSEASGGDPIAMLYAENCAGCHGPSIDVASGTNLHQIIAQGKHQEGMPAWNADLTTDQIDALAGFILSPDGNKIFDENCAACHVTDELVASDPLELRAAIETGSEYEPHAGLDIPDFRETLADPEKTALLNFLIAPDGQRLFTVNCAPCHGQSVAFTGSPEELRQVISRGGLHLEMPPWRQRLSQDQLQTLAEYVVDPLSVPDGAQLFGQYCTTCHGDRVPDSPDVEQALQTISEGGAHETMPVWGDILTSAQLDALVSYTEAAAKGTSTEVGQQLFSQYCTACHGEFGEGGPNPARPGDIIAPISSAEYLRTRDDITLRSIISQGQPNFGMSPFGSAYGGPLEDEQIDAIVSFLRSWQANPPVELPPEIVIQTVSVSANEIYSDLCSQCHGPHGEGGIGPAMNTSSFQSSRTDKQLFTSISEGHPATPMIAWGEVLTSDQIEGLVRFIRGLESSTSTPSPGSTEAPSFANDILPVFDSNCSKCHGNFGGWDASSYDSVMTSGNNAPVVIAGDATSSLLAQKILGTQIEGGMMPPGGLLPADQVQLIVDWINAGAPNN